MPTSSGALGAAPPYKGRTLADVESLFDGLGRVRAFEERAYRARFMNSL